MSIIFEQNSPKAKIHKRISPVKGGQNAGKNLSLKKLSLKLEVSKRASKLPLIVSGLF
jgi:hypothetical protein